MRIGYNYTIFSLCLEVIKYNKEKKYLPIKTLKWDQIEAKVGISMIFWFSVKQNSRDGDFWMVGFRQDGDALNSKNA